ncbi:MAG TPA: N-acetylmuramoyl-L-alanine amidase [Bacteroidales bacterium]|nr:N-acetylmuramoyl-L-alanine amidase [Bacteroidales bacterium]
MYIKYISKSPVKRKLSLFLIYFFIYIPLGAQVNNLNDYHLKTVVIDPGHGDKDPGSMGDFSCEKDIVLAIALKLGKYIETKMDDVKVVYTRTTDEFVPLYKRAEIANNIKADLFLSIHANGLYKREAIGTETLVLGLHRAEENFEVAKRENSVIEMEEDYTTRYAGFDPNSPESYIMLTLMQSVYFDHSINLAKNIQDQFRDRARRIDRGVKQQGLLVLAQTSMPGVLIETGFLTNPEEEKYLMTEEGQDYIASAIFRAFRDYKYSIESRTIFTHINSDTRSDTITDDEDAYGTSLDSGIIDDTAITAANNSSLPYRMTKSREKSGEDNIEFKVQIAVSGNPIPLDSDFFKELNDVWEYKHNHLYKYAVGSKKSYNEIIEYSKWIRNRFPDAFIIAVKNGKIISMEQALKESVAQTN